MYRSGVVAFLKWLTLTANFPFVIDGKIQVSSFPMMSADWKEIHSRYKMATLHNTSAFARSYMLLVMSSKIDETKHRRRYVLNTL